MMMSWALIVMYCAGRCVPTYVEAYPSKQVCESKIKVTGVFSTERYFCTPLITGDSK